MWQLLVKSFVWFRRFYCSGHLSHAVECFFLSVLFIFMPLLIFCTNQQLHKPKLKNMGVIPLIFRRLGLRWSWKCDAHHRELSHPFSQLACPRWPRGNGSPALRLSDSNMGVIIPPQRNPVLWCGTGKYVTYFLSFFFFGFVLTSPPLPALFFSLIFRSRGDSVFQGEAYCPLAPQPPICNWKHTNGLAGESSVPVGLLLRLVDSDPLIPHWEERGRGGERDLGSWSAGTCQGRIKLKHMWSEGNMRSRRGWYSARVLHLFAGMHSIQAGSTLSHRQKARALKN